MVTIDRAKLQEMVLNNMGVTYQPLYLWSGSLHYKGHLRGQLLAAQFTRTGSYSTGNNFTLVLCFELWV